MSNTALLIVDLQNDYFPGGKWELNNTEAAAGNASTLLQRFRDKGWPIVHVRHEFPTEDAPFFAPGSQGAQIHTMVKNEDGEPVVVKHQINCFHQTDLKSILDELGVNTVVICGAMSHMCVDAATRAAADMGFNCAVAHDACATRDLEFNGTIVPAEQVHAAYMSALGFGYANVKSTSELVKEFESA